MKNLIYLIFLFLVSISYHSQAQSNETNLYLKQELIKQRNLLLDQAKQLQTRIDAIDQKLNLKSDFSGKVNYLNKNVNYKTKNTYAAPTRSYNNNQYRSNSSRSYHRGSRGGCYYINSNGNKTYVDRSKCN